MTYSVPDHYSYKFKFDIEKLPASQKDRIPCRLAIWGIFVGFIFAALGLFEVVVNFFMPADDNYDFKLPDNFLQNSEEIMMWRYIFDAILLGFGILIITISIMSMLRYKKIFFDGDKIKIIHRQLFGEKHIEVEDLFNYLGVLLKVEYFQLGFINRNRYIIELYHKDKIKRVPLYISTSGKNVRKIWEYYARKLKMPALFMTDHGLISKYYAELNKTLKEMAKKWQLKSLYHNDEDMPDSVSYKVKKNKVILKEKRLFFDVFSILAFLGVIMLGAVSVYAGANFALVVQHIGWAWFIMLQALILAIIITSLLIIFSKDVLIVTNRDIILGHNVLFLRVDAEFMPKDKIEAVDIGHNPTTDRYYLSVVSQERSMVFGKNMPIDDLRWVRGFIIREVIK